MYYGARYYLPTLRRFISADTVVPGAGNPQALNRFAYTVNNPLKYIDPTGHMFGGFTRGLSEYVHYNSTSGTYERGVKEIVYPSSSQSSTPTTSSSSSSSGGGQPSRTTPESTGNGKI
jgi:hypothetical protein